MKQFLQKHKVFLIGLASALVMALYEFMGQDITDWWVVGYAGFVAVVTYLARNTEGQWVTISTTLLAAGAMIYQAHSSGNSVNVFDLVVVIAINLLGIAARAPKDVKKIS
jgi:hypothetical protein